MFGLMNRKTSKTLTVKAPATPLPYTSMAPFAPNYAGLVGGRFFNCEEDVEQAYRELGDDRIDIREMLQEMPEIRLYASRQMEKFAGRRSPEVDSSRRRYVTVSVVELWARNRINDVDADRIFPLIMPEMPETRVPWVMVARAFPAHGVPSVQLGLLVEEDNTIDRYRVYTLHRGRYAAEASSFSEEEIIEVWGVQPTREQISTACRALSIDPSIVL